MNRQERILELESWFKKELGPSGIFRIEILDEMAEDLASVLRRQKDPKIIRLVDQYGLNKNWDPWSDRLNDLQIVCTNYIVKEVRKRYAFSESASKDYARLLYDRFEAQLQTMFKRKVREIGV